MSLFSVMNIGASGMRAESIRLNTIASNLSNANVVSDTEGGAYRSKHPVFRTASSSRDFSLDGWMQTVGEGVEVSGIVQSQSPPIRQYQPDHPMADAEGYIFSSNVNPVEEMANLISASESYRANAQMIQTAAELAVQTLRMGQ